ncbi:MAG: zf-HC2 domain-containing protein [Actinobacteria bacterium]|nr:zf-HC2 domain-containing protein [Actinomycetota bacterium]
MNAVAHRRLRRSVSAFADAELPRLDRTRVGRHLADCPGCRNDLEVIRAVKVSLDRLGRRRPVAVASARLAHFAQRLGAGATP